MENEIDNLIASLDINTLHRLPCFYDRPDKIQFRMGLSEGPKIEFYPELEDLYYLHLRDLQNNEIHIGIRVENERFNKLQVIFNNVRNLCNNSEYCLSRDQNLRILIGNIESLVRPITSQL